MKTDLHFKKMKRKTSQKGMPFLLDGCCCCWYSSSIALQN